MPGRTGLLLEKCIDKHYTQDRRSTRPLLLDPTRPIDAGNNRPLLEPVDQNSGEKTGIVEDYTAPLV